MLAVFGRPDTWNALLLVHLAAAFALCGGILAAAAAVALAARRGQPGESALLARLAFRTCLFLNVPALVLTVAFGEALAAEEDASGTWLQVSYGLTYVGGIVGIALLTVLSWRMAEKAEGGEPVRGLPGARAAAATGAVLLVVLGAVAFLMTGKPGA